MRKAVLIAVLSLLSCPALAVDDFDARYGRHEWDRQGRYRGNDTHPPVIVEPPPCCARPHYPEREFHKRRDKKKRDKRDNESDRR